MREHSTSVNISQAGEIKQQSRVAMIIALLVNILGLAFIVSSVTRSNHKLIELQEGASHVQRLHGRVVQIDEILTMSCLVASTTSDERWRQRYHSHVPILDETLTELIKHSPEDMHDFVHKTTTANTILVQYEQEALEASKEGRRARALELMTSPDYATQKERYSEGMRLLNDALQGHFQRLLRAEQEQIKQRELLIVIVVVGLAIFWVVIFKSAEQWRRTTRAYLKISGRMKRSLQERLADHEQLVEQRGLEIEGLRRALLDSEQQERKRLGQLVHDDLQQLIAALRLKSSMYRDLAAVERDRSAYQELVSLADEALTSTRDLVMRLTPPGEYQSSLKDMISAICVQFKQRYDLSVEVDISQLDEPEQLEVRQLMSRVIRELLFNVVKYAKVSEAEVRLWSTEDYDHCIVRDHGVGFEVSEVPTNKSFIKTRLGLIGLREQLAMIGGQVEITSARGEGTLIHLCIPNSSPLQLSSRESADDLKTPTLIKEESLHQVLIVDDNHALRDMLVQLFNHSPDFHVVGEASSGPEAVTQSALCQPDLLLIDYSLPGFDGAEAAQKIRAELDQLTVVGFTSFDLPEVVDHFRRAGASRVLLKDSDPQRLLGECLEALSERRVS